MSAAITRRAALAAIGLGVCGALAACEGDTAPSDRTAQPGPNQPDDPTGAPSRAADSEILLAALDRAGELAQRCREITGATDWRATLQEQVQTALDEQVTVLANVLRAGNVEVPQPSTSAPAPSPDDAAASSGGPGDGATASGSPGDTAASTGDAADQTSGPSQAELAAAALRDLGQSCLEDVSATSLDSLSTVTAANLPMLISIAGQRGATAHLFGQVPRWGDLTGPTDAAANSLLAAYRPAVYGFEVLAARASGEERTAYEAVLDPLRTATRQITQLAGKAAAPAPLGYGLPTGTGDEDGRKRLAGELLAAIPPAIMGQTRAFAGDGASIAGSVRLLADAVRLAQPWNPVTGFPGMRVPGA